MLAVFSAAFQVEFSYFFPEIIFLNARPSDLFISVYKLKVQNDVSKRFLLIFMKSIIARKKENQTKV